MRTNTTPQRALTSWQAIVGERGLLGAEYPGRDLWPVTAEDGVDYFLKRLGPWRNLPLADEARILRHVSSHGVPVAEFEVTDCATLYAGEVDEAYVLMPLLASDVFTAAEIVSLEGTIGAALARLHLALANYPRGANSYIEDLCATLAGELTLPLDIARAFDCRRKSVIAAISDLPVQLVHGDLTPDNVLLKRPGAVSGFIDFDHLPLAPRIWDIARYLSRRIRVRWRDETAVPDASRLNHVTELVDGYHTVSPLNGVEIEALPALIMAANLVEISYATEISAGRLRRRKLPDHDDVLADSVEAARWHLGHEHDIVVAVQHGVG